MDEKALFFQGPPIRNTLRTLWIPAVLSLVLSATPGPAVAQVLHLEDLPVGTHLVFIAQAEATATAVAWPAPTEDRPAAVESLASGELTLASDLAAAFRGATHAPRVVVAVGAAARDELVGALAGAFGTLPLAPRPPVAAPEFGTEGGTERRLGAPGSTATLRLRLPLPPLADGRRSATAVLFALVPHLLARQFPGLRQTVGTASVTLELPVEPAAADLYLDRIRRRLAQLGDDPCLDEAAIRAARRRLEVTRRATLEELPGGARRLVPIWLGGGDEAIRQYLFGISGADLRAVREAARTWLPRHPGRATILLPPQALNPRFAGGPKVDLLDNGLSVALLERPATPLAVLCVLPVTSPDLAGDRTGTVLARLAGILRQLDNAPAWVRVTSAPPSLLIAAAPDGFSEALEALTDGLRKIRQDTTPLPGIRDPRHVVLGLAASLLGTGDPSLTPARLLAPGNLALGAVVPDLERAEEALHKLLDAVQPTPGTTAVDLGGSTRRAVALPGPRSALAMVLDLPQGTDPVDLDLGMALLQARLRREFGPTGAWVLHPSIPGRSLLLALVEADGTVDVLQARLERIWGSMVAPPTAEELGPIRHRVASAVATRASGTVGAARRCAELAASGGSWRRPGEIERMILAADPESVASFLEALPAWDTVERAVAGPLPVGSLELPKK